MLTSLGQPYYYNASTKQSTYTRPLDALPLTAPILDNTANNTTGGLQDGSSGIDPFRTDTNTFPYGRVDNYPYNSGSQWRGGGKPGEERFGRHRPQPKDRPKLKYDVPGCPYWFLVKTKLGRRFVYNSEKNESFWRIPPDVMKGVIEFERQEREKRIREENGERSDLSDDEQAMAEMMLVTAANGTPTAAPAPRNSLAVNQERERSSLYSDSDENEEVEVTDNEDEDEDENVLTKRQRIEAENDEQPVEFNEDDIEFQLAAMGQSYGLDPGEYGGHDGEELEEGAEGLALTEEDSKLLFRDMLNDLGISPYTTWDNVIEAGYIVEDERYTVLPNMRSRKEVWSEWTRDTIHLMKEQREKEEQRDPKIPYLAFLQKHATPKLYWPEFRRKYKKEPEMHHNKISEKDREKWYRDHISRLKLPEATQKTDLVKLLKSAPLNKLNRSTRIDALPTDLLTDLRYISLRPNIRDPLIEAHISTLSTPAELEVVPEEQEALARDRQKRQQREEALAERQRLVETEKRKQNGALRYSKGVLREGEEEIQRAMRVGKEGLLGHITEIG